MRFSGRPPIEPIYVTTLKSQITEAYAELKRGIDADWRASVLRYPAVLDYFYSLVEFRIPSDDTAEVAHPPFAQPNHDWERKHGLTAKEERGYRERGPTMQGQGKKKSRIELEKRRRPPSI
jgi:hypothetical protein